MHTALLEEIQHNLERTLGRTFSLNNATQIYGGDINECYKIIIASENYFLKTNTRSQFDSFRSEFNALEEIRHSDSITCPKAILCSKTANTSYLLMQYLQLNEQRKNEFQLGKKLAEMHRHSKNYYGWKENNFIGRTAQNNSSHDNWAQFWIKNRLTPQRLLAEKNLLHSSVLQRLMQVEEKTALILQEHEPTPSLLHGDLWSGNTGFTTDGQPVIFDPAMYYGDRETDIAMAELFGGFGDKFYAGYNESWTLSDDYPQRRGIYQLYHLVNHFNLFGQPYDEQIHDICKRILRQKTTP